MKLFFYFLIISLSSVFGQRLTTPQPASTTPSTTSPCGCAGSCTYTTITTMQKGRYYDFDWNKGDLPNNGQVEFSLRDRQNENTKLHDLYNVSFANNNRQLRINLTDLITPGEYALQWRRWPGTEYYSCAAVNITADPYGIDIFTAPTIVTGTLSTTPIYRETVRRPQNRVLIFKLTGPTGVENPGAFAAVAVKAGVRELPSSTDFDEKGDTVDVSPITFGVCPKAELNPDPILDRAYSVAIYGGVNSVGQSFSVEISELDARLNVSSPPITMTPHFGNMYYLTEAFKTLEADRHILLRTSQSYFVERDNNENYIGETIFQLATDCGFTQNRILATFPTTRIACIQLTDRQGLKYLQVKNIGVSYQMSAEVGLCEDYSAALLTSPFISFSILLIAILILF